MVVDVGREPVGGALGEVDMLAAAVLIVGLELPLKFLGPSHDCINALGPISGDWWTGLGDTQFGLRFDNGGIDGPMARFIDRGDRGGLSRAKEGASMETDSGIAYEEGTTSDTCLLPCPGSVPCPLNGGGATAGRGNYTIGYELRRLGQCGNTAGVGGSVPDIMEGGARGGTGFKFKFGMAVDVSLISPSSCGRRTLNFSDNFAGGSGT